MTKKQIEGEKLMTQLSLIDFILRLIPEGFLFVFAGYVFSNTPIKKDKLFLSGTLVSVSIFVVRSLPVHFGVHTLMMIAVNTFVFTTINKIEVIRAISAILISVVLMFILEGVNVFVLSSVVRIDIEKLFENSLMKNIYALPSLILFGMILLLVKVIKKRKNI
jgi:hypothetical protein